MRRRTSRSHRYTLMVQLDQEQTDDQICHALASGGPLLGKWLAESFERIDPLPSLTPGYWYAIVIALPREEWPRSIADRLTTGHCATAQWMIAHLRSVRDMSGMVHPSYGSDTFTVTEPPFPSFDLQPRIAAGLSELHRILGTDPAVLEARILAAGHPSSIAEITEATDAVIPVEQRISGLAWDDCHPDAQRVNTEIEREWNALCAFYYDDNLRGPLLVSAWNARYRARETGANQ